MCQQHHRQTHRKALAELRLQFHNLIFLTSCSSYPLRSFSTLADSGHRCIFVKTVLCCDPIKWHIIRNTNSFGSRISGNVWIPITDFGTIGKLLSDYLVEYWICSLHLSGLAVACCQMTEKYMQHGNLFRNLSKTFTYMQAISKTQSEE